MGAVDLVIQVESPKSVARGLQRIGRAGHTVGRSARGGSSRSSAPTCSSARSSRGGCARRDRDDGRPAQPARRARPADRRDRRGRAPRTSPSRSTRLHELVTRTHSYADAQPHAARERARHARRPLPVLGVRGAAPADRLGPGRGARSGARPGARQLAITSGGTIPDRGLYAVTLPDGRRVGELDEEMVYEARPGQTFLLGATTWRIEEITRDRVIVTPAPGLPGAVPFWKGDGVGRPKELGEAIGAFARWAVEQDAERRSSATTTSIAAPPGTCVEFLSRAAGRHARRPVRPRDRDRALPRRDRRLAAVRAVARSAAASTPPGGSRSAPGSATSSGSSPTRSGQTTGSSSTSPTPRSRPTADLVMIEPDEVEDRVVDELAGSALFGARFRENAGRALLIPRARPGKRTPLWQQRLKAQSLLEVARKYDDFPIVLETYRECLRDVLDLPGLIELLTQAPPPRDLAGRGRDRDRLADRLVAAVRLRRHVHVRGRHAERRAPRRGAVAGPRPAARAARAGGAARPDRPRRAGARRGGAPVPLRRRAGRRAATSSTTCCGSIGDLSEQECRVRVLEGLDAGRMLDELQRRAPGDRDSARRRGALDRRRRRRAVSRRARGGAARAGCPLRSSRTCPTRLRGWSAATRRRTGRSPVAELRARYGVDCTARADRARARRRRWCAASFGPGGSEREWCDPEVLRRAAPRVAGGAAQGGRAGRSARAGAVRARLAERRPPSGDRRRRRPPARGARAPAGAGAAGRGVGARRAAAAASARTRRRGWTSCARRGEVVWIGAGALGRNSGRVALYFREDLPLLGPPPFAGPVRAARLPTPTELVRERLAGRRVLLHRPARRRRARARGAPGGAVGSGVGGRGRPTTRSRRCARRG